MSLFNGQDCISQLAIDCVIFGYQDKELKVLVSKLKFKGDFYLLQSGFILQTEDIDHAAYRILQERTGISEIYLEQFHVFGNADRNNVKVINHMIEFNKEDFDGERLSHEDFAWLTSRFVSIGYYALVDINKVKPAKSIWDDSIDWYNISEVPTMIIDHNKIIDVALGALRSNLDQKLTAFNLLPETFTMKDIQELYEAIFDKSFARNNFQKKILGLNVLERLEKKFTGAQHKAPFLYRLIRKMTI